jgi:hypothetical protein
VLLLEPEVSNHQVAGASLPLSINGHKTIIPGQNNIDRMQYTVSSHPRQLF